MAHSNALSVPAREGLRERRKRMTRAELLLAGRKLFSEKGLYLSRVEDLTSGAGIAKGTLYQYFQNKEDLIHAVVAAGFDELGRWIKDRSREARGSDDLILKLVSAHIEFLAVNSDLMRIFHQARGLLKFDGDEWQPLRAAIQGHLRRVADLLGDGGAFPDDPAIRLEVAEVLFGATSGALSVRASTRPGRALAPLAPALSLSLVSMAKTFAKERARTRKESNNRAGRARAARGRRAARRQ